MLPKTKYARSDDVLIAYQVTGEGPVDVVLAPGTMSHLDLDWEIPRRALFFERFSANYTFKQKGKSVKETGSMLTLALQKGAAG